MTVCATGFAFRASNNLML